MFNKKPHPETCERCPHRFSETGCPAWIGPENGFMERQDATGAERLVTGCFYPIVIRLMQHVIQAANRPAAAMNSWRNEMVEGIGKVARALQRGAGVPALEHKPDAERD